MDHLIKNRNVIKEMKRNKISHFLYLLSTLISTNQRELPMLRLVYKRLIEIYSSWSFINRLIKKTAQSIDEGPRAI